MYNRSLLPELAAVADGAPVVNDEESAVVPVIAKKNFGFIHNYNYLRNQGFIYRSLSLPLISFLLLFTKPLKHNKSRNHVIVFQTSASLHKPLDKIIEIHNIYFRGELE